MISVNDLTNDLFSIRFTETFMYQGSDKEIYHRYSKGYSFLIGKLKKSSNLNFMEIGLSNSTLENSSIFRWKELFENPNMYGLDMHAPYIFTKDGYNIFLADQNSIEELENAASKIESELDIIIDDGSHELQKTKNTFNVFFPKLSKNGIYIIEDVRKKEEFNVCTGRGIPINHVQTVEQIENFLADIDDIAYNIIDCRPDQNDDSVLIGIWKI